MTSQSITTQTISTIQTEAEKATPNQATQTLFYFDFQYLQGFEAEFISSEVEDGVTWVTARITTCDLNGYEVGEIVEREESDFM